MTRIVEQCTSAPPLDPVTGATVDYQGDGGTVVVSADSGPDDNCVEYTEPEYDAELDITYSGYCVKWRVCGGERLDDIVSGEIAGENSTGKYREYIDQVTDGFNSGVNAADALPISPTSVNDFLLGQGLGEPPNNERLPVFNWCADHDDAGTFDPFDQTAISFTWDLTFADVYDIPGSRNDLYAQLVAKLDLYKPDIGLVPPVEKGFTFVQWPTWMFLQNPSENISLFTTNNIDTLRIDLQATLLGVEWHFGDSLVADCTAEDMVAFNFDNNTLHPINDLPPCHHVFTTLGCQNLTATARFKIEEKVRGRLSATLDPYPDTPWSDYLGSPTTIELTTTLANYEIHPVSSLNAANGLTREQIMDNARAAGTIPTPTETCNYLAASNN